VRSNQLSQFDHVRLLTTKQTNDWILFLDDDDLLLPNVLNHLSSDINGFVGYQYIPEYEGKILKGSSKLMSEEVVNFISTNKHLMIFLQQALNLNMSKPYYS